MIDVNDLNKLDCNKAMVNLIELDDRGNFEGWTEYEELAKFIEDVKNLQRKYTKPIAALLKGPNG